jgi:hypothetical protein
MMVIMHSFAPTKDGNPNVLCGVDAPEENNLINLIIM